MPTELAVGKVVLVTGASSGFGRAIAEALHARGNRVYGTTRQPSPAALPCGCPLVTMDVDDDASVAEGVARILQVAGQIDVLVNNAGVGYAGAIEDTSIAEARAQFETNFFGMHRVCRAVLPHLRARGGR